MSTLDTFATYVGSETKVCKADNCNNTFARDNAVLYAFGITHYSKDKGQSYLQIHDSMFSCSDECAIAATHKRIEDTKVFNHGEFHENLHPNGEFTDELVKQNVSYTPMLGSWQSLPKRCALSACGKDLTNATDIYVPHVDAKGHCYQDVLMQLDGNDSKGSLDAYNLGACCLDHAYQVAHAIVDFILADEKKDRSESYAPTTVQSPIARSRK